MSSYQYTSRYGITNNIVVCGSDEKKKESFLPQQDLSAPSVEYPMPCEVPSNPYQNYNSGLLMTPDFNKNAVPEYWPPPGYTAPPAVSSFQWGHPYAENPVPQNIQRFPTSPYTIGTGHNMAHDYQPFVVGTGQMSQDNQPYGIGTGHITHNSEAFCIGTGEIAHNNQTYGFGIGQIINVSQHSCECVNVQAHVSQNSQRTLQYGPSVQSQTHVKSQVENPYTVSLSSTTTSEASTPKNTKNSGLKSTKLVKLNTDVLLTEVVKPTRPETPVRDENKPLKCLKSDLITHNKKKENSQRLLQSIRLVNGKIIKSNNKLDSTCNKSIRNHSTSIKQNNFSYTKKYGAKKHSKRKSSSEDSTDSNSTESDTKYYNKRSKQKKIKYKIHDKSMKLARPKDQLTKEKKKRSSVIEKLKLKLQRVDEEIRKRQIDLTIKNKLIKKELTSIKSKEHLKSYEDNRCVTKKKMSNDMEPNYHSMDKVKAPEPLKTNEIRSKPFTKSSSRETEIGTNKIKIKQTELKTEDADKKCLKNNSNKQVKSVVKVVKCLKPTELKKCQHDRENCRTHRDKYYIIREKNLNRSIHNKTKPEKEDDKSSNKSKIKIKNTVFNTKHDDLVIMFNNDNEGNYEEEKSQERKVKLQKRKPCNENECKQSFPTATKIKKIELIINVITKKSEEDVDSDPSTDLSFLDDINADEIAEYLNISDKQGNCEAGISHNTLNSSDAYTTTTSPASLAIDESLNVERYESILNSSLVETMIIDERKEGDTNTNNNEIKIETEQPVPSVVEKLALVSEDSEICSDKCQVSSIDESQTLDLSDLNAPSKDKIDCISVSNNRVINTKIYENAPSSTPQNSVLVSADNNEDSWSYSEINNNNETSQEPSIGTHVAHETGLNHTNITKSLAKPCAAVTTEENLDRSIVIIEEKQPEVIRIVDESQEVITISDDDTQEIITITDEIEEIITTNETQKVIIIKDEARDNVGLQKLNTFNEKEEASDNVVLQKLNTVSEKTTETIRIEENNKKEELLHANNKPTLIDKEVRRTCMNDSGKSRDGIVNRGDISISTKDIVEEMKPLNTSLEEKHLTKDTVASKTFKNTNILCSKSETEYGDNFLCTQLQKILDQEASKKTLNSGEGKVKTLVKTKKTVFTQKIIEKMKKEAENGRENEFKSKAYLELMETWEKEVALALKLEKRVAAYMHLDLVVCSVLHRGTFSILFNCVDRKGLQIAAKIMSRNPAISNTQEGYRREEMLKKLQETTHKEKLGLVFLINGLAVDGRWCFLMDFYAKNLEQALREAGRGFHINLVLKLAKQLVSAVTTLKNNQIVHSDIKPTHILLNVDNTTLKLCGFDESYYSNKAQKRANVGTVQYRAPEVILGHSAGHSIDVWATALVFYEMVTNEKLFTGTSNNELLYQHMSTLGAAPWPMVQRSAFKYAHYVGQKFCRRYFPTEKHITKMVYEEISTFRKSGRIATSLLKAYVGNWCISQKDNDMMNLHQLYCLMSQMLVLDPDRRISILDANMDK